MKVAFSEEDTKKIKAAGYDVTTPKKDKIPVAEPPKAKSPEAEPPKAKSPEAGPSKEKSPEPSGSKCSTGTEKIKTVDNKVVKKIEKYKKKSPNKLDFIYIDDGHLQYCKKGKKDPLTIPLITSKITYQIPYSQSNIQSQYTFVTKLNATSLNYTKGFFKEISMNYNNYNKMKAMELFKDSEQDLDYVWFKEVDEYVKSLSVYDSFTVLGYSYHSFEYINSFLICKMTPASFKLLLRSPALMSTQYYFPFYVQAYKMLDSAVIEKDTLVTVNTSTKKVSAWIEDCKKLDQQQAYPIFMKLMTHLSYSWWEKVMNLFKDDFKRIIDNAPPVKKETVVYRGVKDDYFLKGAKDNYYKNTCFVSCTLNPPHALLYLRDLQCCFKRITLLPGTRVLFISGLSCYPLELEIVVNVDSTLYIQDKFTTNIYNDVYTTSSDMCFNKVQKRLIDIAEIVVV